MDIQSFRCVVTAGLSHRPKRRRPARGRASGLFGDGDQRIAGSSVRSACTTSICPVLRRSS
ncbi:MAG TPA: hypothetical protein VIG54_04385, partial [Lysobacter sp.]